jgi:gliding motility-associated-like protein
LDLPDSISICQNDTFWLDLAIHGDTTGLDIQVAGDGNWVWFPALQKIRITSGSSFALQVEALNAWGCADQVTVWVEWVDLSPSLSVSATPPVIVPGQSSQLSASNFPGWSYEWTPAATLDDPFVSNPIAMPDTTTTYVLSFTDVNGCMAEASVTVQVATPICDDPYIYVPNTFTPNGDQVNDRLYVRGAFIDELVFMIYDRWGNQVFATTDKLVGWDGTYQQTELVNDVFGYYLQVKCYDGHVFTKRGNITLLKP